MSRTSYFLILSLPRSSSLFNFFIFHLTLSSLAASLFLSLFSLFLPYFQHYSSKKRVGLVRRSLFLIIPPVAPASKRSILNYRDGAGRASGGAIFRNNVWKITRWKHGRFYATVFNAAETHTLCRVSVHVNHARLGLYLWPRHWKLIRKLFATVPFEMAPDRPRIIRIRAASLRSIDYRGLPANFSTIFPPVNSSLVNSHGVSLTFVCELNLSARLGSLYF